MSLRSLRPLFVSAATSVTARSMPARAASTFSLARLKNSIPFLRKKESVPAAPAAEEALDAGTSIYDDLQIETDANVPSRAPKQSTWHKSSTANFKTSQRKLNDLSRLIAGRGVDEAILQLKMSPKKSSSRLLSMVALARDHAVAKGLSRQNLVIGQSWTSQGPSIRRIDIKGRGRRGIKHHPSSKLHVLLAEGESKEEKKRNHKREGWRMSCRGISEGDGVGIGRSLPIRNARPYWTI